jgi:hypothetical protein
MTKSEIIERICWSERYLCNKYSKEIDEVYKLFIRGSFNEASNILKKLPTVDSLTEELVERLKGKSVYKTVKLITSEQKVDDAFLAKGLSSLITHAIIEMKDRPEYLSVVKVLMERLNSVVFGMK